MVGKLPGLFKAAPWQIRLVRAVFPTPLSPTTNLLNSINKNKYDKSKVDDGNHIFEELWKIIYAGFVKFYNGIELHVFLD